MVLMFCRLRLRLLLCNSGVDTGWYGFQEENRNMVNGCWGLKDLDPQSTKS